MNVKIALTYSLIFSFAACMLLAVLFWGASIGVEELELPSQINTVYAQTTHHTANSTTPSNSEGLDATIKNNTITTFSARGLVSSLVITVPESHFNITNAFKVILTGGWNLTVYNGDVTDLAIKFIASPMDGSRPHVHQITDFRPYNNMRNQ
jgi:hypothetical protein